MLLNHSLCTAAIQQAGSKSAAEESLSIGKWLENFITFTAGITQALKVQSFSSR